MRIIGLTGGIGSGKSTVSDMFKEYGIPVIDADEISRDIVKKGSNVLFQIENEFGREVLNDDDTLNRKKLASIVFSNKDKLEKLNEITHPVIRREILSRIEKLRSKGYLACVVDAALLIEAGFYTIADIVVLVYADKETQLQRIIKRDNITLEEAENRIESQMPFEKKKLYADLIIDNSGDIEYTKQQLNKILEREVFMEDFDG